MTVTIDIWSLAKGIGALLFIGASVVIITLVFANIRRFFASRRYDVADRERLLRRWAEVEALLEQKGELSAKLAVIEADKLLDHALKALAMPGQSLGERLKFAQYKYPKLREVWWAHKVRNQLVHEASYHLDRSLAKKAVRQFEKALKLIGAI